MGIGVTNHSTSISGSLEDFLIEDLQQQWGESYRYMASSNADATLPIASSSSRDASVKQNNNLASLHYESFPHSSPRFAGVQQRLQFTFSSLDLSINPKTTPEIIALVMQILTGNSSSSQSTSPAPSPGAAAAAALAAFTTVPVPENGEQEEDSGLFMEVQVEVARIKMVLQDEGSPVSELMLSSSGATVKVSGKGGTDVSVVFSPPHLPLVALSLLFVSMTRVILAICE